MALPHHRPDGTATIRYREAGTRHVHTIAGHRIADLAVTRHPHPRGGWIIRHIGTGLTVTPSAGHTRATATDHAHLLTIDGPLVHADQWPLVVTFDTLTPAQLDAIRDAETRARTITASYHYLAAWNHLDDHAGTWRHGNPLHRTGPRTPTPPTTIAAAAEHLLDRYRSHRHLAA